MWKTISALALALTAIGWVRLGKPEAAANASASPLLLAQRDIQELPLSRESKQAFLARLARMPAVSSAQLPCLVEEARHAVDLPYPFRAGVARIP